ncbi:MAG: GlxA family transcriptional regulator [Pseudomonadota bacterium]
MPSFSAKQLSSHPTRRTILFVVYPDVKLLDLAGPLQAFNDATFDDGRPAYKTAVASIDGTEVQSDTPLTISSDRLEDWKCRHIDTLIITGGSGARAACKDKKLLNMVSKLAGKSDRVGSVCTGAFILAACGLLDGKRAVTHWESCNRLCEHFPLVKVETDPIYIKQENVWTSAGVTAGLDMALAMIAEDLGRTNALNLARSLVSYMVRPGGQSQFSSFLDMQTTDISGRFETLHKWMAGNLEKDLSVEQLANKSGMSPRNFARAYVNHTGQTPAKAVEALRTENARRLLEDTDVPITSVAIQCGFMDDERMRRAFMRRLNVSPNDYRMRFRQTDS